MTRETRPGFPFTFECKRSGNCCSVPGGVVRVKPEDITAIAKHLGITEREMRASYVRKDGGTLVDGDGSRCVFLADGAKTACEIYPVRPRRCREWPFWPELRDDPAELAGAMRLCPGIAAKQS